MQYFIFFSVLLVRL